MKIDRLTDLRIGGGHSETCMILVAMQAKINELIDAHNANHSEQYKDMTFEEALVHFKAGKKIRRDEWPHSWYISKDGGEFVGSDINKNDWRVCE